MATSIHIPPPLLAAVDRKARALRISRNRLIVHALEHEVAERTWSPSFFAKLRDITPQIARDVDALAAAIRAHRRSKPAPVL